MPDELTVKPLIRTEVTFTPEQNELCLRCLRSLHDLMPIFDKAEECGIDCTQYRDLASQETTVLEAIRKNFMTT